MALMACAKPPKQTSRFGGFKAGPYTIDIAVGFACDELKRELGFRFGHQEKQISIANTELVANPATKTYPALDRCVGTF